jgi:hypothetical protein
MHTSAHDRSRVGQSALQSGVSSEPNRVLVQEELEKLLTGGASFWNDVVPRMASEELKVADVRELIRWGLMLTDGSYEDLAMLFHLPRNDSERFVDFLKAHNCHLDLTPYGNPVGIAKDIWLA